MIAVFLGPRFIRSAKKLSPGLRTQVEAALSAVADQFGEPHRHTGLGLRKLGPGLWECRVDLQVRIVFIQDSGRLRAYDLMTHNELRAWLRRH